MRQRHIGGVRAWSGVLVMVFTAVAATAAADRTVHDIFVGGVLAPGIRLVNGTVKGDEIHTVSLGANGWARPMFEVRGLDIDISNVGLPQIHLRMVAGGKRINKPSYSDVRVYCEKGPALHIKQFPFRSYRRNDPNYMMKSGEYSNAYVSHPDGKDFGRITGLGVKCNGGISMRFSKIQILIDASMDEKYPDDPAPDPAWRGGRFESVFAVPVSERVFRHELDSPLKDENAIWRGGQVHLSGARNETVAFQVVMQAARGANGLNDVNVIFPGVRNGRGSIDNTGAEAPGDPYNYVGKHIQLYRTRYVHYDRPAGYGGAAKAAATLGKHIPEIQIPFEASWGGAPFPVFPGTTQAVWVDIYVPKDAPAGTYRGNVEVLVGSRTVETLPVRLTVHDFALPNRPSVLGLMVAGVPSKHGARTPEAKWELAKTYRQFFRRHHGGCFSGLRDGDLDDPKTRRLWDGSIYTREYGYEGPGEGMPTRILFIKFGGGGFKPFGGPGKSGTEADWHAGLAKYQAQVAKFPKGSILSYYVWDEPTHAFKGGIGAFAAWFNSVPGPYVHSYNEKYGADIKLFCSMSGKEALSMPLMDIYAPRTRKEALEMTRRGDLSCKWNGPQGTGHFASALRVVGWKAYHLEAVFWWMWHATAYSAGFDVYRDPYNFHNQYGEEGAGVGMFVYPGTDVFVSKRNPGLDGPVPGTRFFNWRQGFIDAEYVALAAKKDPEGAQRLVEAIVTGATLNSGLPEEKRSVGYPVGEARYAAARARLVEMILGR